MSSTQSPHPQDEDLMKLLDGELPGRQTKLLQSHMDACWTCRTRLEEFESSIEEYVRYRANGLKLTLPPPPRPWQDLRPKFEELDRSLEAERIAPAPGPRRRFWPRPAFWVAAAACLMVGFLLFLRIEHAPSVKAAELLRKASAVEPGSDSRRYIRIKSRHRLLTRPAVLVPAAAQETQASDLKQMFDSARFNWDAPLSASAYAAWREGLFEKRDEVEAIDRDESAGVAVYVIKTSTLASSLRRATLTLRASDLRPMREMLEFTSDTVEIMDVPEAFGSATAEVSTKPLLSGTHFPAPAAPVSNTTSPAHQELEVFAALHRIGADLGEPIEIRQTGSQLLVIGTGLTETRKEQLRAALGEISGVAARFDDAIANAGASSARSDRAASTAVPKQARLQALLGNRESVEDFTNRVLDASDAIMARVHALRALARAFSLEVESGLTPADGALLETLRDDHTAALSERIGELQRILEPVIAQPSAAPNPDPGPNWQRTAETLFAAAQQVDDSLNGVLAGAGAADDNPDFGKLGIALAELQSRFAAYEKTRP